jgi:hypothetical protein
VRFDATTAQLEPDSVVLRNPTGKHMLLEQNDQAHRFSRQSLLKLFPGRTIEFQVTHREKSTPCRAAS